MNLSVQPNRILIVPRDEETKRLVFLSAYASKAAYGTIPVDESPYLEKNSLQIMTEQTFKPTFDGSIKQLALRIVATSDSSHDRTIFVAVRGSAPMVDWLINFNGDEVDTPFLVCDSEYI